MKNIIKYAAVLVACLALPAMAATNPKVIYAGIDADGATVAVGYDAFDVVTLKNSGSDPAQGLYKLSYKKDDGTEEVLDSSTEVTVSGDSEVTKQFPAGQPEGIYKCSAVWTVGGRDLKKSFIVIVGFELKSLKLNWGGAKSYNVPIPGGKVLPDTLVDGVATYSFTSDFEFDAFGTKVKLTAISYSVERNVYSEKQEITKVTATYKNGADQVQHGMIKVDWDTINLEAVGGGSLTSLPLEADLTIAIAGFSIAEDVATEKEVSFFKLKKTTDLKGDKGTFNVILATPNLKDINGKMIVLIPGETENSEVAITKGIVAEIILNVEEQEIGPIDVIDSVKVKNFYGKAKKFNIFTEEFGQVELDASKGPRVDGQIDIRKGTTIATVEIGNFNSDPEDALIQSAPFKMKDGTSYERDLKYLKISLGNIEGELQFNVKKWKTDYEKPFGVSGEIHVLNSAKASVAEGSITYLSEEGKLEVKLEKTASDGTQLIAAKGYDLTLNKAEITTTMDLNSIDAFSSFLTGSGDSTSKATLGMSMGLGKPFTGPSGQGAGKLFLEASLGFDTSTMEVSLTITGGTKDGEENKPVTVLLKKHGYFEITGNGTITIDTEMYQIKSVSVTGSAAFKPSESMKGKISGANIKLTAFELSRADGNSELKLTKLHITGKLTFEKLEFTLKELSYKDNEITLAVDFKLDADGNAEMVKLSGSLVYDLDSGIKESMLNGSVNIKKNGNPLVSGSGEFKFQEFTNGFQLSASINVTVEKIGAAMGTFTIGKENDFIYVSAGISVASGKGIPVPYTPLEIVGGKLEGGYNMELTASPATKIPTTAGLIPTSTATKKEGNISAGAGVSASVTGMNKVFTIGAAVVVNTAPNTASIAQVYVWVADGKAAGYGTYKWGSNEALPISGKFKVKVPKDTGHYFSADGDLAAGFGSGTYQVKTTNAINATVLNKLKGTATFNIQNEGNIDADITGKIVETVDLPAKRWDASNGNYLELKAVSASATFDGSGDLKLKNWTVDTLNGNLSSKVTANVDITLAIDVWLYEKVTQIAGTVSLGAPTGINDVKAADFAMSYDSSTSKFTLSSEGAAIGVEITSPVAFKERLDIGSHEFTF